MIVILVQCICVYICKLGILDRPLSAFVSFLVDSRESHETGDRLLGSSSGILDVLPECGTQ